MSAGVRPQTDDNTKTNMTGSLMAVIDNKISDTEKVVAFETGKNDRWIAYKFPREIYFKRLERSNSQPQPEHKAVSM